MDRLEIVIHLFIALMSCKINILFQKPSPREVFSKDRPDAESIRSLVEFNKYYRDNFETSSKCSSSHNVNIHCHHSDAEESYLLNVIVTSSQFIKALHVFNEMLKCSKQNPTSLVRIGLVIETFAYLYLIVASRRMYFKK